MWRTQAVHFRRWFWSPKVGAAVAGERVIERSGRARGSVIWRRLQRYNRAAHLLEHPARWYPGGDGGASDGQLEMAAGYTRT